MLSRGGKCSKMPCESCAVQFSVFKRKQVCCECERYYCSGCLRREGAYVMCAACKTLSTRPLMRQAIAHLKVRDLQCFLQRQNVSTRGCVEKEELVNLCMSHVNSSGFRRRGPRSRSSPFNSFKGFTNHLNVFINNAFDIRTQPQPAPPPPTHSNCYNAAHAHAPAPPRPAPRHAPHAVPRERFTTTPGGERDIVVPVPSPEEDSGGGVSGGGGSEGAPVDTADCFEIEDLDDAGWEFVSRPAEPLPNDSEVLLAENEVSLERSRSPPAEVAGPAAGVQAGAEAETCAGRGLGLGAWLAAGGGGGGGGGVQRAASELELRPRAPDPPAPDSVSLQDEPREESTPVHAGRVSLSAMSSASQLEALSVKQLKELLGRNRVAYTGCLERADLLERARRLWREHHTYAAEVDKLPLEECCKICMAAPLECVLLECGHIAACTACAKQLAECPICRQYVVRAVRFFRS